ncbi:MAG: hypothetical protein HQK51_08310 [Oligoflexia bacterium]|nr:hypothetical protein [Oligoflexia bacterium]
MRRKRRPYYNNSTSNNNSNNSSGANPNALIRQNQNRGSNSNPANADTGAGTSAGAGPNMNINVNKNNPKYQLQQFEEHCIRMEKLRDSYLKLRKRFFENYHKFDQGQKDKSEQEIFNALKGLRRFEDFVTKQYRYLSKKNISTYELDTSYTTFLKNLEEAHNNSISSSNSNSNSNPSQNQNINPISFNFNDLHMTPEQLKKVSYKNDCEESVGNIEDYQKHKIEKKIK